MGEARLLFVRMAARLAEGGVVVLVPPPHRVPAEYAEPLDQAGLHAEVVPTTAAVGSGFVIGSRLTSASAIKASMPEEARRAVELAKHFTVYDYDRCGRGESGGTYGVPPSSANNRR